MNNSWNERYSQTAYVYGEAPNDFFAEQLNQLQPGSIILPCEGEGRNGVYAATHGWKVNAFDSSEVGKAKALQLAAKKGALLEYTIEDAVTINYPKNCADVVAFIYAHFPADIRKRIHQKAITWVKPGGRIILEAFNPQQLQNKTGGPKDLTMLYTEHMVKEDFEGCKIVLIQTLRADLKEGKLHEGLADIVRYVGIKI